MALPTRLLRPQTGRYLLDQYGGAAAAYSLRRLRTGYTGPVVQVRRSNDSAEETFTPEQIANGSLTAWTGANDGFVKTWYDQSISGNNLIQNTAGNQPKIVSSGVVLTDQSRPTLEFVASRSDRLDSSSAINLGTECSFFVVARLTRNHSSYSRLITEGNTVFVFIGTDPEENVTTFYGNGSSWGTTLTQTATTWLNATRLVTTINDGSDNLFINGAFSGSRANALGSFNETMTVGSGFFGQFWQGPVSEWIVYSGAKLLERPGIERLILPYYSLT